MKLAALALLTALCCSCAHPQGPRKDATVTLIPISSTGSVNLK